MQEGEKLALSKLKAKEYHVKKRGVKTGLEGLRGDISVLESAANLEKRDVEFYRNASKKALEEESRKFFKKMQLLEETPPKTDKTNGKKSKRRKCCAKHCEKS